MVKALLESAHVLYICFRCFVTHFSRFCYLFSSTISKEKDTPIATIYIFIEQLKTCYLEMKRKKGKEERNWEPLWKGRIETNIFMYFCLPNIETIHSSSLLIFPRYLNLNLIFYKYVNHVHT